MVLYQTVEDRNNPDYIEANAPFQCNRKDAWLGVGYYFWDTFLENAHWWGNVNYQKNGYVIVEFTCDFVSDKCFDLQGNMEHVKYFKETAKFLCDQKILNNNTTVPWLIEYLKTKTDFIKRYQAIRVYGHYSKKSKITLKMYFSKSDTLMHYLELTPAVQLCLFQKSSLSLSDGKIVYPTNYISDYVI